MSDRADAAARLAPVLAAWGIEAARCRITSLSGGHINDSFVVREIGGAGTDGLETGPGPYLLQRINDEVFPDPLAVMQNQRRVLAHLGERGGELVLPLLPTRDGAWHVSGPSGVWRLQPYLVRERGLSAIANAEQAVAAGEAYGRFQALLANLPAERLAMVLPRLHDLAWHLEQLDTHLSGARETAPERLAAADEACRFVAARRHRVGLADQGPRGIIHGDCKLANLLFAPRAERVVAVLDLDTVMPGPRSLDFGDLVRSAATAASGDAGSAEVAALRWYEPLAAGFWRGFREAGARPPDSEAAALRAALADAPCHMSFMLGVRFLVDYLGGDRYFRRRAGRNGLERAQAQFALTTAFEAQRSAMTRILARL